MTRCRLLLVALLALALPAGAQQDDRVAPSLRRAIAAAPAETPQIVWIFFRDKGPDAAARLAAGAPLVTARALSRRALRGTQRGVELEDLPPAAAYVEAVARSVVAIRQQSRWFDAVSAVATPAQIEQLARLPFVARVDVVRRYRTKPEGRATRARSQSLRDVLPSTSLDYGTSYDQVAMIGVPALHDMGLHGEGVVIAIFDAGFNNLAHEAFASLQIAARHDFVNHDDDVGDGADHGEGSHGTMTLSTLAGFKPGQIIGPAYAARFLLAKTENTDSETPIEEDNWTAAAEWAEGLGADVISSSLGYLTFDAPFASYTYADMNGQVAISTRAAELAASRGVVVVNSAGNSGFDPTHNTLGAPADGVHVIAAGAVDPDRVRTSFSSVGPTADGRIKPDVAAQGLFVKTAAPGAVDAYDYVAGTSFSCPLTAGVVALLLEAHPTYTVDQVIAVLRSTASQAAAPDNLLGWGIVNGLAAVQAKAP